jgi:hypothetical protein
MDEIAQQKGVDHTAIRVWLPDETWVGQKRQITHRWASRGTRLASPRQKGMVCRPATANGIFCSPDDEPEIQFSSAGQRRAFSEITIEPN